MGLLYRVQYKTRLWDTLVGAVDHVVGVCQVTHVISSDVIKFPPIFVIDEVKFELWLKGFNIKLSSPITKVYVDCSPVAKVPLTVVDKLALNTYSWEGVTVPAISVIVGKVPPVEPVIGFIAKKYFVSWSGSSTIPWCNCIIVISGAKLEYVESLEDNILDAYEDDIAYDALVIKVPVIGESGNKGPITVKEPDNVTSYACVPVKASIDWVTCHVLTVLLSTMPVFDNILAISFYK